MLYRGKAIVVTRTEVAKLTFAIFIVSVLLAMTTIIMGIKHFMDIPVVYKSVETGEVVQVCSPQRGCEHPEVLPTKYDLVWVK